jgi:GGDEF domain-containing protein
MNWMKKLGSGKAAPPPPLELRRLHSLPLTDLVDLDTGWYQRWYFMARLGDEMAKTRKSRQELTLVYTRVPLSDFREDSRWRVYMTLRLSLLEREARQAAGFFGRLSEDEFAVCVSGTRSQSAATAAEALRRRLDALAGESGIAVFPASARDVGGLVHAARQALRARPANVVSLDDYRYRRQYSWGPRAA